MEDFGKRNLDINLCPGIDNIDQIMKFKFSLLLCWLGIHQFKLIDSIFGFGSSGTTKKVECKICGIIKMKKG